MEYAAKVVHSLQVFVLPCREVKGDSKAGIVLLVIVLRNNISIEFSGGLRKAAGSDES